MPYFIAINSSCSSSTTYVSRTSDRVSCITLDKLTTHPEFVFPNEYSAKIALVEATNKLRQKPVGGYFTTLYKLNLLKRMSNATIVSHTPTKSHPDDNYDAAAEEVTIRKPKNPLLRCADGFTMSVQASERHYCTPLNDTGPYTEIEIGFPNMLEPLLIPFQDEPTYNAPTESVYCYVPVEIIDEVIAKHGGLIEGTLPPRPNTYEESLTFFLNN
tara:strand:- start:620 stop:1264 length:645 start_codon:yes stop_codon:yes gene_type:complete